MVVFSEDKRDSLGDVRGHALGWHLAPGTKVFACEFAIDVFDGADLCREYDAETGLPLWQGPEHREPAQDPGLDSR